ncbi:glycoside hydrolase superfamily [Cyathus striatus]|nr:glycoside hydrolase superfamily [Cyathus striatus]
MHMLPSTLLRSSVSPLSHYPTLSLSCLAFLMVPRKFVGELGRMPWITPSIFDNTNDSRIVDEWTFGQYQDHPKLSPLSLPWIHGLPKVISLPSQLLGSLNHVRLPIGYWAFDVSRGEPFIQGQLPYLHKAVQWAQNHNLKIIIDLHGVPGSQNGFDNSGQRKLFPEWHTNQDNIKRTNTIIKRLASDFKNMTVTVPVIEPLNKPAGFYGDGFLSVTKQYWYDSYGNIRYPYGTDQVSNTVIMIHDSSMPIGYWNGFMNPHSYEGVILDTHIYQIFSTAHIRTACNKAQGLATEDIWVVVGEWTPAAIDCARYLNGRGVGARYDGSYPGSTRVGSCDGLTDYKDLLRHYWEAQVITFDHGQGWIEWTWKAENADEWSYEAGLENGWIPHDPTDLRNRISV